MNWYKRQLKMSQRKIEFSEDQLQKLKQLSEQGVFLKELSKIFGVSVVTLRKIIKEYGQNWNIPSQIDKTRNINLKKWTQDELQVIKELLREGENYNQIAKLFNVSFPTIKSVNKRYHLVRDEEIKAIAEEKLRKKYEYITGLYLPSPKGKGLSLTQIEREYGVAAKTVIKALKELGLYEEFFRRPSDANRHRYESNPELGENHSRRMKEIHRNNPGMAEQHSQFMKQLFIDEPERANEFGNRIKSWWKQFEDEGGGNKLQNRLKSFPTREQAINSLKGFVMSKRSKNPNEDLESMAIYNKYMKIINDHTFPNEVQQEITV